MLNAAPPAAPPAAATGGQAASPQQQAQYEQFVKNGMRIIYGKKSVPAIVKALDADGDPVAGLANTVSAVVMRLTESAKKAGKPLAPEVVLYGAGELLEQLADFSEASGGHKYDDAQLKEIAQSMVDGLKGAQPSQPAAPAAQPPMQQAAPAPPELMPRMA